MRPRPRTADRRLVCLGLLLLAGCGVSAYEERLARTNERNRHFARLDDALQAYWNHPGYGLWLRPPKSFVNVPGPPPPKEKEEPKPDLRQEFQGVPLALPGIIQAWDAVLPTAGGGVGPYRIYILGNHERFLSADEFGKPNEFFEDLEVALEKLFGVELPKDRDDGRGDRDNEKFRQMIPHSEQFSLQKLFLAVNFAAHGEHPPLKAWLFEHTSGKVECAVLVLTPPAPSPLVRQSILTSLETLQVSPQPPRGRPGAPTSGSGAGGPVNF